jgi:high affinity sulfate transporter 1
MALSESSLIPVALRGYQRSWLSTDVVAGATLAAVAIPECMGYTSIAQTPVVTGLYTVIFPTVLFALLGCSRLLVVGADSATAAILAAGLASVGIAGLSPNTALWVAYCGAIAVITGVMLLIARLLRLGFIGDFLSASVLIGFLTGVGVQVLTGQIPSMLGISKGTGGWFEQQWHVLSSLGSIQWETFAFAAGTLVIIVGFKRFVPRVPGAIVAVILSIAISAIIDASAHGVDVVGSVTGGFPPVGAPKGVSWSDNLGAMSAIAFSCMVLIVAQSAATSRSFAMKHGDPVDVNRDLIGLGGANLAAAFTGTFVVNGSPTKTQILDSQKGKTQVANLTMSVIVLLVVLFFTGLLTDMPKATLGAIVFLIGIDLIDLVGLKRIKSRRLDEFVIAAMTAVVVCAIGVEQGIVLAIVVSLLELVRRQYSPKDYLVTLDPTGEPTFQNATPGSQSAPGLMVFRFDAELFYANANRFVDHIQSLIGAAPDQVRWFILDAGSLTDIDYSAGLSLGHLLDYLKARGITFGLADADDSLLDTLTKYGLTERIEQTHIYGNLTDAVTAFHTQQPAAEHQ